MLHDVTLNLVILFHFATRDQNVLMIKSTEKCDVTVLQKYFVAQPISGPKYIGPDKELSVTNISRGVAPSREKVYHRLTYSSIRKTNTIRAL